MTIDDRLAALGGMSPAARLVRATEVRRMCTSGVAAGIRRDSRASLVEVAAAVGVTAVAISDWEAARSLPTGGHAVRYGEVLDTLRFTTAARAKAVPKPKARRVAGPPPLDPEATGNDSPAEAALRELIHLLANPGPPDPPAPAVHRTDTTQDHDTTQDRIEESHG